MGSWTQAELHCLCVSVSWFTVYTTGDLFLAELSPTHKHAVEMIIIIDECIVPGVDAGELPLEFVNEPE